MTVDKQSSRIHSNIHGSNTTNDINNSGNNESYHNTATSQNFKDNYGVAYHNYNGNANANDDDNDESSGKVTLHDHDDVEK